MQGPFYGTISCHCGAVLLVLIDQQILLRPSSKAEPAFGPEDSDEEGNVGQFSPGTKNLGL